MNGEVMNTVIWWDLSTWQQWQAYLLAGIVMAVQLVAASVVVGRTGRTPYWSLLTLVPLYYVLVAGIWAFAYCEWPKVDRKKS